jgi:predicted RNA-binding protein with PIN domain
LIVSGTTVSGGDKTNYTSVASYFMAATFDTTAQKSVFAFKEMSSGYPNSVTYTPPSTTATSFIGITNAAISSGATGEVAVKGGLSTNQSSLTIGSNYFVQDDGSLATTSSSTKAGKAISTTALNLVDPT